MSGFVPKKGIGAACAEAARRTRLARVLDIRKRHWDRLGAWRHNKLDNALYREIKRLNSQTITG